MKMREPRTDKQRYWAQILEQADSSGETLADYARANNLSIQTLYQWRSTLKKQSPSKGLTPPIHFSKVVTADSNATLSVELNGVRLRFDRLPEVHWLGALIRSQSAVS